MILIAAKKRSLVFAGISVLVLNACGPDMERAAEPEPCVDYADSDTSLTPADWPSDKPVPGTVAESLVTLDGWLTESQKLYYQCEKLDTVLFNLHFSLGAWIRRNWNFYAPGALLSEMAELGLRHPDDMSSFITLQFVHGIRDEPFDAEQFVEHKRQYWERLKDSEEDR